MILRNLLKEGKILAENKERVLEEITVQITEEFQKEDRLDVEVRNYKHMEKIRRENLEYQTMFRMIKTKLSPGTNIVP